MKDISNVQIYELSKALTSKEAALSQYFNFCPMLNTANMDENKLAQWPEDLISKSLLSLGFKDPITTIDDGNCLF